jgi:hypothetical protein
MDPFAGKLGVENRRIFLTVHRFGIFYPMVVPYILDVTSASTEIRTPVLALKGLRPSPLDDGGALGTSAIILQVAVLVKCFGAPPPF